MLILVSTWQAPMEVQSDFPGEGGYVKRRNCDRGAGEDLVLRLHRQAHCQGTLAGIATVLTSWLQLAVANAEIFGRARRLSQYQCGLLGSVE